MPARRPAAWRRLAARRTGLAGAALLIGIFLLCYLTLPWSLARYTSQNLHATLQAPSPRHIFGTDELGRDLFWRFTLGGAISLGIGLCSATIAVFIGVAVGVAAGYLGGRTDALLMRAVDVLYGLPTILLVILLRVALVPRATVLLTYWGIAGPHTVANLLVLLVGIGGVSWLTMARVIRTQVMSLRNQPFIEAARAAGVGHWRLVRRHLLPGLIGTIMVYAALTVPVAILQESFLSFLGLGIQQPLPSWGNLTSEGVRAINPIHTPWWLLLWPCLGLCITLLSLNFLGDALQEIWDPRRSVR